MKNGLLKDEMKEYLENIIGKCFLNNRMFDRMVSILSVKLVMPITGDIIHHKLAHLYPRIADLVSDYMAQRNCTTIYQQTPEGSQDYNNPIECFDYMLELNLSLEKEVKNAIKLADEINDYTTKVFLDDFLRKLISVTDTILLLDDKIGMYENNKNGWMKFDSDIEDFNIKGEYF